MHYLAAGADPAHFLTTVGHVLEAFGGGFAAVILIVLGFRTLVTSAHGGRDGESSGLRDVFQSAGHVVIGLFFIFAATFIVGIITNVVGALQK